jgi:hypothetical protein
MGSLAHKEEFHGFFKRGVIQRIVPMKEHRTVLPILARSKFGRDARDMTCNAVKFHGAA